VRRRENLQLTIRARRSPKINADRQIAPPLATW
jgi:hypothetical protein